MAGQFLVGGKCLFQVRQFVDLVKGGQTLALHGPGGFRFFQAGIVEGTAAPEPEEQGLLLGLIGVQAKLEGSSHALSLLQGEQKFKRAGAGGLPHPVHGVG